MKRKSEDNEDWVPPLKQPPSSWTLSTSGPSSSSSSSGGLVGRVRGVHSSRKGEREDMQDCHIIIDDFRPTIGSSLCKDVERMSFYAVYDGHNGNRAAKFCAENLHQTLASKLPKGPDRQTIEGSLKRWFLETYKQTDDAFLNEATKVKPVWKDGTTATTLLIINNSVFVANVGDTKTIVCRWKEEEKKEIALTLTKDHSPQSFEERMRIQKAGGNVVDGRILGIIEVSRSIGDGQYKKHGLSCIPDVKKLTLTNNDRYLLIACDGLWKVFNNQNVLNFITEYLEKAKKDEGVVEKEGVSVEEVRWEWVCRELAAEAVRRGSGDNVTVLLIPLT